MVLWVCLAVAGCLLPLARAGLPSYESGPGCLSVGLTDGIYGSI